MSDDDLRRLLRQASDWSVTGRVDLLEDLIASEDLYGFAPMHKALLRRHLAMAKEVSGDSRGARALRLSVALEFPQDAASRLAAAEELVAAGKAEAALGQLRAAFDIGIAYLPALHRAWTLHGCAHVRLGEIESATASLRITADLLDKCKDHAFAPSFALVEALLDHPSAKDDCRMYLDAVSSWVRDDETRLASYMTRVIASLRQYL